MKSSEPSRFWQALSESHRADLEHFGFETIKRHQALRYFTWQWRLDRLARSSQFRFLLRHQDPRSWLTALLNPVTGDAAWVGLDWSPLDRRAYTFAVRLLWRFATSRDVLSVTTLPEPEIGSPPPVFDGGRLISQDLANASLEVNAMAEFLDVRSPLTFLEVGAGYGRTAYVLLSLFPESTYTIIDIEPAIDISRWYLLQLFPPERLRFMSPTEIDAIEGGSVDLAISISSLAEMTDAQVLGYLELFDRVAAGGRVYLKQLTSWHNKVDGITSAFDRYPIPRRWKLNLRRRAAVQTTFTEAIWLVPPIQPSGQ